MRDRNGAARWWEADRPEWAARRCHLLERFLEHARPADVHPFLDERRVKAGDVAIALVSREGLADAGHIEGQNILIEYRWGEGQHARGYQYARAEARS